MADVPRAARAVAEHLQPGEEVAMWALCQPRGTQAGMALGGAVGAVIASRGRKGDLEAAAAGGHPYLARPCTLVPTNQRLFVVDGKKLLGVVRPDELAGAEVVQKNAISNWKVAITLASGARVEMEVNRFHKPQQLVDCLNGLAAPAVAADPGANWYPDPTGRFEHRWFDGTTWTDDVSSGGTRSTDPIG